MAINHRLDLALRCIDTTTGKTVGNGVRVYINGREVKPYVKPEGYLLLMGTGREDCELEIRQHGFEPKKIKVEYGKLAETMPLLEPELIPSLYYQAVSPCHTLSGKLAGITELDAVKLDDNSCLIREVDARKGIMTVFNPHRLELDCVSYAVVNANELTYEPFAIVSRISDKAFKIDRPPTMPFTNNSPVSRLIRGSVAGDGSYLLRVRNTATGERWIVRFAAEGRQAFQVVDFSDPKTTVLTMPEEE